MRIHRVNKIVVAMCAVFTIVLISIWQQWMSKLSISYKEESTTLRLETSHKSIAVGGNIYEHGKHLSPALEKELSLLKRDDIEFASKMERVSQMRYERLEDACSKANLSQSLPVDFSVSNLPYQPVLLVSDEHKAMFCFTGDVYSEMWRELLGFGDVRSIYSYRPESIAYRMKYYFKFLVAQDPLLRLMDAYHFGLSSPNNRVINEKGEDISEKLMKLSEKIQSDYRAEGENADATREQENFARFQDFATYIVQKTFLNEPHHYLWERIHIMCNPCSIKYDYISLAESSLNDVQYLTSRLSISPKEKIIPTEINSNIAISAISVFIKKFGLDLLKEVVKVYKNDYDLFGYSRIAT